MNKDYEAAREVIVEIIHDYCLKCKVDNQVAYDREHCKQQANKILALDCIGVIASEQTDLVEHGLYKLIEEG